MYDVFVSHANADKLKYVNSLVKEIKKQGMTVFYDAESISWGDNIDEKIEEGINNCTLAVVVISKKYFGRNWTEKELTELFNRQNKSGEKIILPLLFKKFSEVLFFEKILKI